MTAYRIDLADAWSSASLIGSYFHSDAERSWQGIVLAEPAPGTYLVELFEWSNGAGSEQRLVTVRDMLATGWRFYDTAEWMNTAYERTVARRWETERCTEGTPS